MTAMATVLKIYFESFLICIIILFLNQKVN